jgi:hypothetical protein
MQRAICVDIGFPTTVVNNSAEPVALCLSDREKAGEKS